MESISKHTPGPWKIYYPQGFKYKIISSSENTSVCDVNGLYADIGQSEEHEEQHLSDAKLIAAAPDLLSKLEQFIELYEQDKLTYKELEEARKLIFRIKN